MSTLTTPARNASVRSAVWAELLWAGVAVAAFHVGYEVPALGLLMGVYLFGLVKLTEARTARRAFYWGFGVGMACFVPQLWFFWGIFHFAAVGLWAVGAIWLGFFVLIGWGLRQVPGMPKWAWVAGLAVVWMGGEYFRSELYYLKFAWLTPGMALGNSWLIGAVGVYGIGFVIAVCAGMAAVLPRFKALGAGAVLLTVLALATNVPVRNEETESKRVQRIVGIQLEDGTQAQILEALDTAVSKYPDAALLVMSEYTLTTPPTDPIRGWCRRHERYLILGGIQPLPPLANGTERWANTAFVIDPTGAVVFSQGKCVPIQFFDDGVAAKEQRLWNSPWGRIGICICYDLSYSRVTDELIRQGADILVVPTMDAKAWGAYEHDLHARIAVTRAAEYRIPIIRVASSGVSQIINADGTTRASAPFPGQGALMTGNVLGRSTIVPRVPVDRYVAPVCVGVTGVIVLGLLVREMRKRWANRRAAK